MQTVKQIQVGKSPTGIVGLDSVLKELAGTMPQASDQKIAAEMIERLSKKNYIPAGAYEEYESDCSLWCDGIACPGDQPESKDLGAVPSKSKLQALRQS